MADNDVIKIDLDKVLHERLPGLSKFIPRFAVEWMKRTIHQEELNHLLEDNAGLKDAEFCRGALKSLDITTEARNVNRLPSPDRRRVLYVSNHPLGGLDGMALIDYVQRRHGGSVFFVVNDLLTAVKPLENVFLPINKFGKQSRDAAKAVEETFAGDDPIIMFPAGLVSRLRCAPHIDPECKSPIIADLPWNKMFVNKAYQHRRDVIPLFFSGHNTQHFYKMANLRTRLRLKFNFEMIYLPGEMFNMAHGKFTIHFGQPIPWATLTPGNNASKCALSIEASVYNISKEDARHSSCSNSVVIDNAAANDHRNN